MYKDYQSAFHELVSKDNSLTNHQLNLYKLSLKMLKIKIRSSTKIMNNVFDELESSYRIKRKTKFRAKNIHMVGYASETVTHIGPTLGKYQPLSREFKMKVKKSIPGNFSCK